MHRGAPHRTGRQTSCGRHKHMLAAVLLHEKLNQPGKEGTLAGARPAGVKDILSGAARLDDVVLRVREGEARRGGAGRNDSVGSRSL